MIKRAIDISEGPTFLNIENDQLILSRNRERIASIPCEDVGVLMVDHHAVTYTNAALVRLVARGAVVVLCGEDHLPAGILLPVENNDLHTERLRAQIAAPAPLRKQLWRQIVIHKIKGQAGNLPVDDADRGRMLAMAGEVKSGDVSNCEGTAARFYWPALLGKNFRRDPAGDWPNPMLNYGYMVFRAAVARAIVAAGLHPAIGLYHRNRNNPFVLADDLVELFRARVDRAVVGLIGVGKSEIDKEAKRAILELLTKPITVAGQSGPLMVGLHRILGSLVRCYQRGAEIARFAGINDKIAADGQVFDGSGDFRCGFLSRSAAHDVKLATVELSAYRFMWVVVLFDLPVDTAAARRAYAFFRKKLLRDGFTMLQYSVYARHSSSEENALVHINRVQNWVPDDGEVRIITITDKQFERMRIFWGKLRKIPQPQPVQLEFF